MHHLPRYDFRIGYAEEADQGIYAEKLVKGVFDLVLNHFTNVKFIPEIENLSNEFIENYSYDETTIQGVRMACLMESKYVVTPSDSNDGKNIVIGKPVLAKQFNVPIESIASETILFFVSGKTYARYVKEIKNLFNTTKYGAITNVFYRQNAFIEDLKKEYEFPGFIENRIINSPYLSDYELSGFKRKRDGKGTVIPVED